MHWPLIQRLIGVLVITGKQPVLTIVLVITLINLVNRRTTLFAIGVCHLCQPVVTSMLLLLTLDVTIVRLIVEVSTSETILVLIYLLLILLVVRVHDHFSTTVNATVFIILTILVIAVIIVCIVNTIINEFTHLPCKWLLYKLIIVVVFVNVLLPHSTGFMAVLASLARSVTVNNTQVKCWCHWLVINGVIRIHLVRVHIRVSGYRISTLILVIILKSIKVITLLLLFHRLTFQPPSLLRCLICLIILLLLLIFTVILWLPRNSGWILALVLFLYYKFGWIHNRFIVVIIIVVLLLLRLLPTIHTLLWLLFLELPFIVLTCHIVIAVSLGGKSMFFSH